MVSGFDRYFQIAPCFRDEDARATARPASLSARSGDELRHPEDVFDAVEPVMRGVFEEFAGARRDAESFR